MSLGAAFGDVVDAVAVTVVVAVEAGFVIDGTLEEADVLSPVAGTDCVEVGSFLKGTGRARTDFKEADVVV